MSVEQPEVPAPAPPPVPTGPPSTPDWELIDPESLVNDVLEKYPESEAVLQELGLHCWDCPVGYSDSRFKEPLREVARLHEKPLAPIVAAFREMAKRHVPAPSISPLPPQGGG